MEMDKMRRTERRRHKRSGIPEGINATEHNMQARHQTATETDCRI